MVAFMPYERSLSSVGDGKPAVDAFHSITSTQGFKNYFKANVNTKAKSFGFSIANVNAAKKLVYDGNFWSMTNMFF